MTKQIDLNKYKEFVGEVTSNESNNTEALTEMLKNLTVSQELTWHNC